MFTQTKTDTQQIEVSIDQAQAKIAKAEALERLYKNADFKLLIEEGYLTERPLNLVKGMTRTSIHEHASKINQNALIGVASLHDYLQNIFTEGAAAFDAIQEAQAELQIAEVEAND